MSWLYVKVYPDDAADLLMITDQIASWQPTWTGTDRWFYLHFHDASGAHLRLRIHSPDLQLLDDVYETLTLRGLQAGITVLPDLYERETSKWGTKTMAAAEAAFQTSSELCLDLRKDPNRTSASALAAFFECTHRAWKPPPETWEQFCLTHCTWWGGRQTEAIADHQHVGVQDVIEKWAPHVLALLRVAKDLPRSVDYYLHQHLHLTANRLGLTTAQEADVAYECRSPQSEGV